MLNPTEGANALRQLGSASAIASRLGISLNTVQAWHGGRAIPTGPSRALLATMFGIAEDSWLRPVLELAPIPRERHGAKGREDVMRRKREAAQRDPIDVSVTRHPRGGYLIRIGEHSYRSLAPSREQAEASARKTASVQHRPEASPEPEQVPIGRSRAALWGSEYSIDRRGHV